MNELSNDRTICAAPFKDVGFTLHDSFMSTFLRIWDVEGPTMACRYMKALALYGLSQEEPNDDDPIWMYGLSTAFFMIDVDAGRATL